MKISLQLESSVSIVIIQCNDKVLKKKLRAQSLGSVYMVRVFNPIFGISMSELTYSLFLAESVINILFVIYIFQI